MSHHYIKIEDLTFGYSKDNALLKQVSCTLHHGEAVALIGKNGVGKSTLLKLIMGLNLNFAGEIVIGDIPVRQATLEEIRRHIGYVFQDAEAQLFMPTVYEDLAFGPRNYHLKEQEIEALVQRVLEQVGATHLKDRACYSLSGGEKRIISIATVLTLQPDILILDEPSIALDPCSRRRLIRLLKDFKHTKLIATHDLDLVMNLCERTLILDEGKMVYDGPTKAALTNESLLSQHGLELPLCLQEPEWYS